LLAAKKINLNLIDLNSIAKTHYSWLEEMKWNNTTNLESAGMIASEIGEAISEAINPLDQLKKQTLTLELSDILLRCLGLSQRFNYDLNQAVLNQKPTWSTWAQLSNWESLTLLENLALICSQTVPVINGCRKEVPPDDLKNHLALIIISVIELCTTHKLPLMTTLQFKMKENLLKGNKGRVK
jgi:hypothetical protein